LNSFSSLTGIAIALPGLRVPDSVVDDVPGHGSFGATVGSAQPFPESGCFIGVAIKQGFLVF
jgi:hypothetical protein